MEIVSSHHVIQLSKATPSACMACKL